MRGLQLVNHTNSKLFGMGEMDIGIDPSGHPRFVSGRERVRHDLLKGILTGKRGDYGTIVPALVGEKQEVVVNALATVSVEDFIIAYRSAQARDLPDDERIGTIKETIVTRDSKQPTKLLIQAVVRMADGQSIVIENVFGS